MVGLIFRVVSPGNLTLCSDLVGEILCMKPKRRLTQQGSSFVQRSGTYTYMEAQKINGL